MPAYEDSLPPLRVEPPQTVDSVILFFHGLGDEGSSYRNLAEQIHKAGKLQSTRFIFPTADFDKDASERAWYPPQSVSIDEDLNGEVDGFLPALGIVDSLIEEEVKNGIPRSHIILGGFSQGGAVTALWAILRQKRVEDRLAGLILTASYVPLRGRYKDLIVNRECIKDQPLFILHGQNDTLLPLWVAMKGKPVLEEAGFEVNYVTIPGMRHDIPGSAVGYFCMFIESVFAEQAGK